MIDFLAIAAGVEGLALVVATSAYFVKRADFELDRENHRETAKELASNIGRIMKLEGEKLDLETRVTALKRRNSELAREALASGREATDLALRLAALDAENQEWAKRDRERREKLKANGAKGLATQSAAAAAKRETAQRQTLAALGAMAPREEVVAGVRERRRSRRKAA